MLMFFFVQIRSKRDLRQVKSSEELERRRIIHTAANVSRAGQPLRLYAAHFQWQCLALLVSVSKTWQVAGVTDARAVFIMCCILLENYLVVTQTLNTLLCCLLAYSFNQFGDVDKEVFCHLDDHVWSSLSIGLSGIFTY